MRELELLAPARNIEVGIAAVDSGADAVYIAGPSFGARQNAGNSVEDIGKLCDYAAKFGVRVYATVNTILYDSELEDAFEMMLRLQGVGVSAFIVQDLAVAETARKKGITIPLHASTQCSIRTVGRARFLEDMGFSRIVLERQLPLDRIREIRNAVSAEIEFFIHGALCVCYSGECYLSEYLAGRSANRGDCVQACRSFYDLEDETGKVLERNKALLSLKDFNLSGRLADLADAGVCSFKIEGRLKAETYVRNITRLYSSELDRLVAACPQKYRRASFGKVCGGFGPDASKTFNRGYTQLYIDGRRGSWASMDMPKGRGEEIGRAAAVAPYGRDSQKVELRLRPGVSVSNGDGFVFSSGGEMSGFRADVCRGNEIICRRQPRLRPGTTIYRNLDMEFEKEVSAHPGKRRIPVKVSLAFRKDAEYVLNVSAESEDGRKVEFSCGCGNVAADNRSRMRAMLETQFSRESGMYSFVPERIDADSCPLMKASAMNALRRRIADALDAEHCRTFPLRNAAPSLCGDDSFCGEAVTYKADVVNSCAREVYLRRGASEVEEGYELSHKNTAELMRCRYCIRYELGMCLKKRDVGYRGPLYLVNNGRRLPLGFDCDECEMTLRAEDYRSAPPAL